MPLEMGSDFDVHGIGMGTRGWPLMRTCLLTQQGIPGNGGPGEITTVT